MELIFFLLYALRGYGPGNNSCKIKINFSAIPIFRTSIPGAIATFVFPFFLRKKSFVFCGNLHLCIFVMRITPPSQSAILRQLLRETIQLCKLTICRLNEIGFYFESLMHSLKRIANKNALFQLCVNSTRFVFAVVF